MQLADFFGVSVEHLRRVPPAPPASPAPNVSSPSAPLPSAAACAESEIFWQVHRIFSGVADDGQRIHVSLNIMLSKDPKKEP